MTSDKRLPTAEEIRAIFTALEGRKVPRTECGYVAIVPRSTYQALIHRGRKLNRKQRRQSAWPSGKAPTSFQELLQELHLAEVANAMRKRHHRQMAVIFEDQLTG